MRQAFTVASADLGMGRAHLEAAGGQNRHLRAIGAIAKTLEPGRRGARRRGQDKGGGRQARHPGSAAEPCAAADQSARTSACRQAGARPPHWIATLPRGRSGTNKSDSSRPATGANGHADAGRVLTPRWPCKAELPTFQDTSRRWPRPRRWRTVADQPSDAGSTGGSAADRFAACMITSVLKFRTCSSACSTWRANSS